MVKLNSFFTSGHSFSEDEYELKSKFQMLNNAILLSTLALLYVIVKNTLQEDYSILPFDGGIVFLNIILFFVLRRSKNLYRFTSRMVTAQFSFFYIYLFYTYPPEALKFVWVFTYPSVLFFLENDRNSFYWFMFMVVMLFISAVQPFVDTYFSISQVLYIVVVLMVVSAIVYFYKQKMEEARSLIMQQQEKLHSFNSELSYKVKEKTQELQELNESLENMVQQKVRELRAKDRLLFAQSKQAVMGEMIEMIAHQWR